MRKYSSLLSKPALRQLVQRSQILTLDGWDDVLAANIDAIEHFCYLLGVKTITSVRVCQLFEISEPPLVNTLLVIPYQLIL